MSAYEERSPKPLAARRSRVFREDVGGEQGGVGCVPTRLDDEAFGHRLEDGSVGVGQILPAGWAAGTFCIHCQPQESLERQVAVMSMPRCSGLEELEELLGVLGRLGVVERLGDEVS